MIIIGLLSIMTFSTAFGVSGTYTMALTSRYMLFLVSCCIVLGVNGFTLPGGESYSLRG